MLRRPVPSADVIVEELGRDLCLMRLDTNDVLVLNRTATDIWLLAAGITTEELVDKLSTAYGTDREIVRPQVIELIQDLDQRGFLIEAT